MDASVTHHVIKHGIHHPGSSHGKAKVDDLKLLEETRRLHDYLKKNLYEIANCIAIIKTKRNIAFERMTKEAEKLKKRKTDMLKEIQEKYSCIGGNIEKSMWDVISSPNTAETTNSELKVKNKLCNKLKDIRILSRQVRALETEINLMNEQYDGAVRELFGKERMLAELKGSLDNVLQKIRVITLDYQRNTRQVKHSLSVLQAEKSRLMGSYLLPYKARQSYVYSINTTISLEQEHEKKHAEEYNMKIKKLNKKSLIKCDLMLQLYQAEIKDLQSRKNTLALSPTQVAIIDQRLDSIKLEMFHVEMNEYHRLRQFTTKLVQLSKLEDRITALRENINNSGGLKYKNEVYFIDKRGRFFYKNKDGIKIYKEQISSTLLYQLDSLQNLVLINKEPIKPKVVVPVPVIKEKKVGQHIDKSDDKLTAVERDYFKKEIGLNLIMGLAHVTMNRPNNPLSYLGHFLTMYNKMDTLRGIDRRNAMEIISDLTREIHLKEEKVNTAELAKIMTLNPKTPIIEVSCQSSFNCLNEREKRYCYYLCKASSLGKLLLSCHTSAGAPLILIFLQKIFCAEPIEQLKNNLLQANFTDDEIQEFLLYSAAVVTSCGNFKNVARTKMIPGIPVDRLEILVKSTEAYKKDSLSMDYLLKHVTPKIYEPVNTESLFGTHNMFMSANITTEDVEYVKEYLARHDQIFYHKTIDKKVKEDGKHIFYSIKIDSILKDMQSELPLETIDYGDCKRTFRATRGRCSTILILINNYLKNAIKYADYNSQRFYLKNIMNYYATGNSIYNIRASTRLLTSDPPIQVYFGYTQHWEDKNFTVGEIGNVVVVRNKEKMKRDNVIKKNVQNYIDFLPWSSEFEHKVFKQGVARFVDVLQYASFSLRPIISIPYHPNLRKKYGTKHLFVANYYNALENVSSMELREIMPFMNSRDLVLYKKYYKKATSLLVDLTLLIGVGSGRLLKETELRVLNFPKTLTNPLTGTRIETQYTYEDTFASKFGKNAEPLKYLRAIGIALYSSFNKNLFKDLDMAKEADDMIYAMWLIEIYHGLFKSFHDYDIANEKWTRTDNLASFMVARYLLENCGKETIHVEETCTPDEYEPDSIELILNRKNIFTIGKEVVGKLITELTVIKATGDVERGTALITKWSAVSNKGQYPLKHWYTKYISQTYIDRYKISVTPVAFLIKHTNTDAAMPTVDDESTRSESLRKSETDFQHFSQDKSKVKYKKVSDHHLPSKLSVHEMDSHNVKKVHIALEDDTLDEESDDETPPLAPMPTDAHVELRSYPPTLEGAITSFMDSISDIPNVTFMLEEIWAEQISTFELNFNINTNPIQSLTFDNY